MALGHDGEVHAVPSGWTVDPYVLPFVLLSGLLYARGVYVLWTRKDLVHGLRRWQAGCFAAGWLVLVIALFSPLKAWSDALFSAHMSQHELLMLGAAPLMVLGRPLIPFLWAFPLETRKRLVARTRTAGVVKTWRLLTHPLFIVAAHGLTLWLWHIPVLFEAALRSEPVHAVQHAMFFFSAVLFFHSLVYGRYGRLGYGVAAAYVFLTALHSSLLGAFLTFARKVWYPLYAERGPEPLEDQRLAGLIMWVPAGLLLTAVGLALFSAWLGASDRSVQHSSVERLTTRRRPSTRTNP